MNHPENEILLALFDGELSDIEIARLDRHTENCAECRDRLAELEETSMALAGVIAGLDAAEPASWPTERPAVPDGVLPGGWRFALRSADHMPGTASGDTTSAQTGDESPRDAASDVPLTPPFEPAPAPEPEPAKTRTARPPSSNAPLRWAAGILLVAGVGAAAAIYARPWAGSPAPEASPALQPTPSEAVEPNVFHVMPLAGSLDVSLTGVAGPTRIVVAFADQGDVTVEATGPDELHVQNPRGSMTLDLGASPARLRITFPSSLASGTIRVDGRTIARISSGRMESTGQVEGVTLTAEAADRS